MGEQLLPGIPDTVTLNEIVPRLSGTAFHISAISRAWLHATRSYEVYNSRVQSHSTQTHVIVTYDRPGQIGPVIALYCMRDNSCAELPPISNSGGRIFEGYNFVSLDGKVYVLGGIGGGMLNSVDQLGSDEVYVLDLRACQRQWKQCASMTKPRKKFTYGIIKGHGKIYVFEGLGEESQVYEPKENSWSRIPPITYSQRRHLLDIREKDNFSFDRETKKRVLEHELIRDHDLDEALLMSGLFGAMPSGKYFAASGKNHYMTLNGMFTIDAEGGPMTQWHGKNHYMTLDGIFTIDAEGRPMTQLHSFSLPVILPDTGLSVLSARRVKAVQLVDNELLAMVSYTREFEEEFEEESDRQFHLLRTTGFGGKSEEIVWQRVQVPLSSGILFHCHNTLEYTVQL